MTEIDGKRIGALNDRFRMQMDHTLGHWVITSGVNSKGGLFVQRACRAVQQFTDFNAGNDPYGERDMGRIEIDGVSLLWKIDVFDLAYEFGADFPDDPTKSRRVLTVMLAQEY